MRKDSKCTTKGFSTWKVLQTDIVIGPQVVLVDHPGQNPVAMDSHIFCPRVI